MRKRGESNRKEIGGKIKKPGMCSKESLHPRKSAGEEQKRKGTKKTTVDFKGSGPERKSTRPRRMCRWKRGRGKMIKTGSEQR